MICQILHADFGGSCWQVINLTLTILDADLYIHLIFYSINSHNSSHIF
jgi:hypothetical protein